MSGADLLFTPLTDEKSLSRKSTPELNLNFLLFLERDLDLQINKLLLLNSMIQGKTR
jgi:hypothetical protein